MTRLSTRAREELYDAEAAMALASGRGHLPICNICNCPIDGVRSAWDVSHDPHKPAWLGGQAFQIAHRRCNRPHNNKVDTPRYAKSRRQRQMHIGAKASAYRPIPGSFASGIKKPMKPLARPVDRKSGREL